MAKTSVRPSSHSVLLVKAHKDNSIIHQTSSCAGYKMRIRYFCQQDDEINIMWLCTDNAFSKTSKITGVGVRKYCKREHTGNTFFHLNFFKRRKSVCRQKFPTPEIRFADIEAKYCFCHTNVNHI